MTMKFKFETEYKAYYCKDEIKQIALRNDFVNLVDVKLICANENGEEVEFEKEDYNIGWRYTDLKGNHFFVRHTQEGWILYITDPTLPVTLLKEEEENDWPEEEKIVIFLETRLKAMVHHKLNKKTVVERPCWFHKFTTNVVEKEDGTKIYQDLALCQFLDDGHFERVSWENIRIVEEWD